MTGLDIPTLADNSATQLVNEFIFRWEEKEKALK